MARLLRFLVRNWPLKLGAVLLATLLYAGLVASQNARIWPGPVTIETVRQPEDAFLLDRLPLVNSVRYLAPLDVANRLTSADFRATVDLSTVKPLPGGATVSVPVRVDALNPRIQVVGFDPASVNVRLDPVVTRAVPVKVEVGSTPQGLARDEPAVSVSTVRVRGASSLVARVVAAVARVSLDPTAINVDTDADLIAVDDRGEAVSPVDLDPGLVHVRIGVTRAQQTRTVPVVPAVTGVPADGYQVQSVTVRPVVATVTGEAAALRALTTVGTAPIDVAGRSADLATRVNLALPQGVSSPAGVQVEVTVRVVAVSGSRSYPTGLQLVGGRADRRYSLSAPEVLVTLGGAVATLDRLDASRLAATLDVGALEPGRHVVPVGFTPPDGTNVLATSPSQVEVLVAEASAPPVPSSSAP